MAETEVSKEVSKMVAIEEKCVLDMSSYEDLPKPDCTGAKQVNDLDKSYVFVSGSDSENVEAEDSRVLAESDAAGVKDQGAESQSQMDAVSGEFQPLNEGDGTIERSNGDFPLVNVDGNDADAEGLSVLPNSSSAGVRDQPAELHSQIEISDAASGELNEAENSVTELGNVGLSLLPESGAAGVKDQADLHSHIEKIGSGEFQSLNEAENSIEHGNGDPSSVNIDNKDVEAEGLSALLEPAADVVKDQGGELNSQTEEKDAVSVEFQPFNEAENGISERSNGDPSLAILDNKVVEAEGLSVLPETDVAGFKNHGAKLHSQIEKNDAINGNFQPLNEKENSIIEQSIGDPTLINVDNKEVVEAEGSSDMPESDAAGSKDQEAELHSQIEYINAVSGNFQPGNEAIEDPSFVNVNNKDVAEAEGPGVLPESDAAGLKDQDAEVHPQIENDAVSQPLNEAENCIIEQSNRDPPLVNAHNKDVEVEGSTLSESEKSGKFQPLNEAANNVIEQSNLDSPLVNVDNLEAEGSSVENVDHKNVEAEGSSVVAEPIVAEIKDQGAELGSQNESFDSVESRNVEQIKEDPISVNNISSKHESVLENGAGVQVSPGEIETETEDKDVQDPDGKIESSAEAEVEKVLDQNGIVENVADEDEEKFDSVSKAGSYLVPIENQVSLVVALGLVAESGENMESNNILLHVNNSLSANDECEDQSNLCVTEALVACPESQEMVVDVVQRELQDDEVKPVIEVVEPVENKLSPSTSLSSDLASHAVHSKAKTIDEGAKTTLSSEVLNNQQDETALGNNVQSVLGQMDESKTVGSCADSHVQTVSNLVLGEQKENLRVSEVDNGVQYPEVTNEQSESSGVSHDTTPSETKAEASMQTKSYPVSNVHAPQSEVSELETVGAAPIFCSKSQINDEVVLTENQSASQGDEAHAETEVSSGKVEDAVGPSVVELQPEGHSDTFSGISRDGNNDDVAVSSGTEVSDNLDVNKKAANVRLDVEGAEDIRDQLDGTTDDGNKNLFVQESEDSVNSQCSEISVASAGESTVNTSDGKEQIVKIKTKPFNFLIRVPRFDDENLREQIRVAKIHVDEKTKLRDAVQIQIQEKRANSQIHGIDYEYAKSEARSARKLVRSKRMEIDSLQSVINKAKNALSIEDIDSQIHNMEHMIQHETLPLKEEKQLIREIKQLKQLRDQLSSNMGSQEEIKQAIEQRGEVEERLKILRKELDILKNRVLKAEATAAEAEKKYDDENKKVKELQAQFRAADDVRQAAYAQWQTLRKELSKKSEHFFKYKDDAAVASNYAYSRDTESLYLLCMNQVNNFMELWNANVEFRKEYAKFNTRSTVRRFGTLDGRALGPDEVPPRLPSYADERASRMVKVDLASRTPSPEVKQETTNENTTLDNKPTKKAVESSYQKVTKEPAITVQANGLDTHSVEVYKEVIRSKEEIESLTREEEKRREEAEAKLKEQRRVEALAKANEARERKKRQAEKLQMRADLKTQKEAEQREKEREKRLRKKERKKGGLTDGNDMKSINCESGPSSESAAESSSKDIEETVGKKQGQGQKPWLLGKQSKGKSIPPPLRNRNKKKLQQWMWVGLTSMMILVLFWLGNIGIFSNVALKRRGPVV